MEYPTERSSKRNKTIDTMPHASDNGKNPFSIFPEELWILILNCIQTHATLQNLVNAVPGFLTVFSEKFSVTKFVQVSPLTFEHQPEPTMYLEASRLVDIDWCHVLSNFLQQNPCTSSSHFSAGKSVKKELVPSLDFTYLLPGDSMKFRAPHVCSNVKAIHFFHEVLQENGPWCQELLLRNIKFCQDGPVNFVHYPDPELYFDACIAVFSEYGTLLRSVSLEMRTRLNMESNYFRAFFQGIAICLQYLPNVHTLSITIYLDVYNDWVRPETVKFPALPCLQNLDISVLSLSGSISYIQNYLLDCFRQSGYFKTGKIKSLKRLAVPDWSLGENFRCSTKHKLETIDSAANMYEFVRVLNYENKSSLFVELRQTDSIPELFSWLSGRQWAIEELHIDFSHIFQEYPNISTGNILPLPTVRYLKILDSSLTGFEFLTALPSLEYMHVQYRRRYLPKRAAKKSSLSRLVLKYIYCVRVPNDLNIWNEIPTLRLLVVENATDTRKPSFKHFVRDYGNKPIIFKQGST